MLRVPMVVSAAAISAAVACVPVAMAEVNGCPSGQDESIPGCPVSSGVTYTGAFQSTSTHDDLDYLQFTVSKAGQTLQFTVANTTKPCSDPDGTDCPVYLTL